MYASDLTYTMTADPRPFTEFEINNGNMSCYISKMLTKDIILFSAHMKEAHGGYKSMGWLGRLIYQEGIGGREILDAHNIDILYPFRDSASIDPEQKLFPYSNNEPTEAEIIAALHTIIEEPPINPSRKSIKVTAYD